MAYQVYMDSDRIKAGRGYYLTLTFAGPSGDVVDALDSFLGYASTCVMVNSQGDADPAERSAARTFVERLVVAYWEIDPSLLAPHRSQDSTPWRRSEILTCDVAIPRLVA
jgi:hypothetical protein